MEHEGAGPAVHQPVVDRRSRPDVELIVPRESFPVEGCVVSGQGAAELVMDHLLAPRASALVMD